MMEQGPVPLRVQKGTLSINKLLPSLSASLLPSGIWQVAFNDGISPAKPRAPLFLVRRASPVCSLPPVMCVHDRLDYPVICGPKAIAVLLYMILSGSCPSPISSAKLRGALPSYPSRDLPFPPPQKLPKKLWQKEKTKETKGVFTE